MLESTSFAASDTPSETRRRSSPRLWLGTGERLWLEQAGKTVSVQPVRCFPWSAPGELVSLRAMVNYVGNSSMVIGIRVESENVRSYSLKHTNTSYFTMVAMDDQLKKITVPGLILETQEQVRRFAEAISRKHMNRQLKEEMQQIKKQIELNEAVHMLKHERCRINLPQAGQP